MAPCSSNDVICHGLSVVAPSVRFGNRCIVWQFATICEDAVIGHDVIIGAGVWIGKRVTIGNGSRIQTGVFIPNDTVIGSQVFIGPSVTMTDDKYPQVQNPAYRAEPPRLNDYCSIGAGATLLPGVVIGERAMVGAGSVVIQDVAPFATVVGCPAHRLMYNSDKECYETA